jgi:histidine ammonia-lyase
MGATGTYRALKSTKLLSQVLANELICASEAIDRISESPGDGVKKIHCWVRNYVNPMDSDRAMTSDCEKISALLIDGDHSSIFG